MERLECAEHCSRLVHLFTPSGLGLRPCSPHPCLTDDTAGQGEGWTPRMTASHHWSWSTTKVVWLQGSYPGDSLVPVCHRSAEVTLEKGKTKPSKPKQLHVETVFIRESIPMANKQ